MRNGRASTPSGSVREKPSRHHSLDDLVQFGLVAEAGGIGAASRRHGIAKASLSRAITRLEYSAGVALFDRVDRGLTLTEFGKLLVARAKDAVRVAREISTLTVPAMLLLCHESWSIVLMKNLTGN